MTNPLFKTDYYISKLYSQKLRPTSEYPKKLARHLLKDNRNQSEISLLDVGCGRGDMLKAFQGLGCNCTGVDLSPLAKINCAPIEVVQADLESDKLPFDDSTFDVIFSKSVIEHLKNPQHILEESFRCLSKNGTLIFMTPSWRHNYWGPFYHDFTHITPFTRFSLTSLLDIVGFSEVSVRPFMQLPYTWNSPILSYAMYAFRRLPLPYRPQDEILWPKRINNMIRFSKEVMLLATATKL